VTGCCRAAVNGVPTGHQRHTTPLAGCCATIPPSLPESEAFPGWHQEQTLVLPLLSQAQLSPSRKNQNRGGDGPKETWPCSSPTIQGALQMISDLLCLPLKLMPGYMRLTPLGDGNPSSKRGARRTPLLRHQQPGNPNWLAYFAAEEFAVPPLHRAPACVCSVLRFAAVRWSKPRQWEIGNSGLRPSICQINHVQAFKHAILTGALWYPVGRPWLEDKLREGGKRWISSCLWPTGGAVCSVFSRLLSVLQTIGHP